MAGGRSAARVEATDDWQQLDLLVGFPEQRVHELIRPVVLFGHSPAERARQTGAPQRTLYRRAARFAAEGMAGLFAPPKTEKHRRLPAAVRDHILTLKAEHPAFRAHEIATICGVRFDRRPSPHTAKRILAEGPLPVIAGRRLPPYHETADAAERRLAVIRLHSEGWQNTSIAEYLQVDRRTVYAVLRRWVEEGVAGLADKSHARVGPRRTTLRAIATVEELQENPRLGEWRIHAALRQLGIHLSPRTCGRILARNRRLYGLVGPTPTPREPKAMPFKAGRRHRYWTVDLRHLDMADVGGKAYCISILENYSRAILASGVFPAQDLSAFLMVLYAAIHQHGVPEALVSDSGAIFLAKQARAIYDALGIEKRRIERRQPWQSDIEANFGVQARMADWDFARAATWAELAEAHDRWVAHFNFRDHWAHRKREGGTRSPAGVLGWVHGRAVASEELHRVCYRTRFGRVLDRLGGCPLGGMRFRHWRVYGERGLAKAHAAVWLYGETLTIEFADEPLAQYHVRYQPDRRHLLAVEKLRVFETPHRSPQLPLWELSDTEWLKVLPRPPYAPRRPRREPPRQQVLFE